ncbi:hypothetical protein GJ744_008407 [Endocarpon pusillum]|uniref:Uncharacterized protein n=1 Tax=Endocarpon pusillum TaxID=364733 RepID=A0A8H7AJD1_9EURO|nr:hypothetical protein GJ744_008407 [Endocarpon pusillum]
MSTEEGTVAARTSLSKFEIVLSCNPPILASFLLHAPTTTIFQLYHTSSYLRQFLRSYPTAWKYLSFRLLQPSPTPPPAAANVPGANGSVARQSRNYALDQLLLNVVNPYSSCLKSLELDNTAVSGQILISTVLSQRRETLEHLSIRGCKNVSLKYHIVPWLTLFSLQMGGQSGKAVISPGHQGLALKSLYTYRCRHHRRRPYLPSSLTRKDSDSEPTHELVILCHQLGIWTDTAWCTTPGVRCFRRRGYVTMRAPADTKEVWVVYDRLWRSKNWVGSIEDRNEASRVKGPAQRDGRVWEQDENGTEGEALGVGNDKIRYGDGKHLPMHLRKSHCEFVEAVPCDNCSSVILERCEQCSVLMHCAGCRKTLCASCAFDRPYTRNRPGDAEIEEGPGEERKDKFWWAPGYSISPCSMQDQDDTTNGNGPVLQLPNPSSKFKWCCTEPVFSGGGGITFGPGNSGRDFERMRAAPLPKGEGWEDAEFHSGRRAEKEVYLAQEKIPSSRIRLNKTDHYDVMHQLLGPEKQPSLVPRNLCDECYASRHWKVKCKACSQSLCLQHDLRGLKMRLCGYRDLASEKEALNRRQKSIENMALSLERLKGFLPARNWSNVPDVWHKDRYERLRGLARSSEIDDADSTNAELGQGPRLPALQSSTTEQAVLHLPAATPSNHNENDRLNRPTSPSSNATAAASRSTSPAPSVDSVTIPTPTPEEAPEKQEDGIEPHPKWSGCLGFACPQFRGSGDHRQRCSASFKECAGCKVNVCKECADKMPKPCRCEGCVERSLVGTANPTAVAVTGVSATINGVIVTAHAAHTVTASTSTIGIETNRFWCPNCRWERVLVGRCKAGRQRITTKGKGKGKDKGKEKGKRKSQGSSEETTRPAPAPTGIDDETAQNVAEFEDLVARGDEALHAELNTVSGPPDSVPMADPSSIPAPPPLPLPMQPRVQGPVTVSINNAQHPSTNNAEERDLDRISAMVDDLQTRIERLRVVYASRRQQSEQSDAGDVGSAERSEIVDGNGDGEGLAAVEAEEMD